MTDIEIESKFMFCFKLLTVLLSVVCFKRNVENFMYLEKG